MHTNLRSLIRRRQHVKQQRNISTPQHEISFHLVQRLHSVFILFVGVFVGSNGLGYLSDLKVLFV